jgi:hypothetical protein
MWARLGPNATAPLVDANACRAFAAQGVEKLDERIAKERASTTRKDQ